MKQLKVTELDFDDIKLNLKEYFRSHPSGEYNDWDFEGSGLSHLLDILAYNTHYNAIIAHNAMNESFIDSAQIRANVVSRAKLLGYTPRSQTASMAMIKLTFDGSVNKFQSTYTLYKGQTLTTAIDGVTYQFVTRDDYSTILNETTKTYTFDEVVIYQGRMREDKFVIESGDIDQKFILEDPKIDLDHLHVEVYDNAFSTSVESYELFTNLSNVGPSTPVFFISENYEGNYEIKFGDDIFGKKPSPLSVVEITYLSSHGPAANGANVFTWTSPGPVTPSITTVSSSTNGSAKEDIESIRRNAPLSFTAQNRAVTAGDYKTLIRQIVNNIETVSVWGGEDNIPPQYGKVYCSVKPFDANTLTELDKTYLMNALLEKRVIGIEPIIIDPEYTYIYLDVLFKYDSTKTSLSGGQLATKIEDMLVKFNTDHLQQFDGIFKYSRLLAEIDNVDVSISNSYARVYTYKVGEFKYGNLVSTPIDFQFQLYGKVNQRDPIMSTSSWVYNDVPLYMEDEPIPGSTSERNIYAYTIGSNGVKRIMFRNVGTMNVNSGLISINSLPINRNENINIHVSPASNDIISKRNKLLSINVGRTNIVPELDTIAISGSSGIKDYQPFLRHRNT